MATKSTNKKIELLPYKNPGLSLEKRVEDLLGRLTLEEKIGQMCQLPIFADLRRAVAERGIGSILCGVDENVEELQHLAVEKTRLGIPLLVGIDAIHGHSMAYNATMFPTQLGLSCAWDETLCEAVARATAKEMAYTGCQWTFSPVLCTARDLRWGRVNETFGEDPYLIGKLACAMIRGYQGKKLSDPDSVAACAKHFAGYGETMGGREASESDHSERKMRAVFLPPFEAAAQAGCASFMTAYQVINGVPCTTNAWLLRHVLRDEWKSDAMVVTDWANMERLRTEQFTATDDVDAVTQGVCAGNDMCMSVWSFIDSALQGVKSGAIPVAVIDEAVARILRLKFRLGLFENPRFVDYQKRAAIVGCAAHHALALRAARESAVLLKNTGILPLRLDVVREIAVIGPNADDDLNQLGDWSLGAGQNQGVMQRNDRACTKTILDGMVATFGEEAKITYAQGCGGQRGQTEKIARAVRLAEQADVVVLALGDQLPFIGEGHSTATLELQGGQNELFEALVATGTPIVVVFISSKPLVISHIAEKAEAVLCVFNPGMEGGVAIAEIIRGQVAPQGRLTVSFPNHVGQQPVYYNQTGGAHHHDYPDLPGKGFFGLYSFGYGLTYTTFKYSEPVLAKPSFAHGETVKVSIEVRNSGSRDAVETVQVYFCDCVSSVTWPRKNLIAFRKVPLKSGELKKVAFELPPESFAIVNGRCERVVESGEFELMIGKSSRDMDLKKVRFTIGK